MAQPLKPPALRSGDAVRVLSLSSPVAEDRVRKGCDELARLGYVVKLDRDEVLARDGFFAGSEEARCSALEAPIAETDTQAIISTRGGYGSNYLLDCLRLEAAAPKILCGFSDITSLHVYLWQKIQWANMDVPMAAS